MNKLKRKIQEIIFEADTPMGKLFDLVCKTIPGRLSTVGKVIDFDAISSRTLIQRLKS